MALGTNPVEKGAIRKPASLWRTEPGIDEVSAYRRRLS